VGADVGDQVRPATGTGGDPKLPFTGYALIVIAALGLLALASGGGLHALTRLRLSRRRA
jgi:hypothetical protein